MFEILGPLCIVFYLKMGNCESIPSDIEERASKVIFNLLAENSVENKTRKYGTEHGTYNCFGWTFS